MVWFPFFGIPLGLNLCVWGTIGGLRWVSERTIQTHDTSGVSHLQISDIAVIIPAHDEELVIGPALKKLKESLDPSQIYVASDGSTDRTTMIADQEKVHVVSLIPGLGKAKALRYLLDTFDLLSRYRLIMIVDADTLVDPSFFVKSLVHFDDPEIVAVFAAIKIHWPRHVVPIDRLHLVAYRERLHWLLYHFFSYGQTWKYTNLLHVLPGFCVLYRSETLKKIDIDAPGLLIEDFNTAFQIHKHKLGKIGFSPDLIAYNQHPDSLSDYWKQVQRWNIGFFQTVRKNGVWVSWFWIVLIGFLLEVSVSAVFLLFFPITILSSLIHGGYITSSWVITYSMPLIQIDPFSYLNLRDIILPFFIVDYICTILAAWFTKKPQLLFYGLFFIFMHIVTSIILVFSIFPGFLKFSEGRWISPKRQSIANI